MAAGRCAGCGRIDSLRKIRLHIADCTQYLKLFQHDPARCLTPADEYERHCREDKSALARAEQRGTRMTQRFAEYHQHQAASVARWQRPPDILD